MSKDAVVTKVPRGVRNNNPGNIKELVGDKTNWQGERTTDDDPTFEEFNTPEDGFRALARTLLTYQRRHNIRTPAAITARFAPGCDSNDEADYRAFLARHLHVGIDDEIDLTNRATLIVACVAIMRREQGYKPGGADWWPLETIAAGVDRALEGA